MQSVKQKAVKNLKLISPNWLALLLDWQKENPEHSNFQLWPTNRSKIPCPEDPLEICFSITNTRTCIVGEAHYTKKNIAKREYSGCIICRDVSMEQIFGSNSWKELWQVLYDWSEHFLKRHKNRLVKVTAK